MSQPETKYDTLICHPLYCVNVATFGVATSGGATSNFDVGVDSQSDRFILVFLTVPAYAFRPKMIL